MNNSPKTPTVDALLTFNGVRYSEATLRFYFDLVADASNWKNPIDCTLPGIVAKCDREAIAAAVVFYAGCSPEFTGTKQGLRVTAPGYYKAVGA